MLSMSGDAVAQKLLLKHSQSRFYRLASTSNLKAYYLMAIFDSAKQMQVLRSICGSLQPIEKVMKMLTRNCGSWCRLCWIAAGRQVRQVEGEEACLATQHLTKGSMRPHYMSF